MNILSDLKNIKGLHKFETPIDYSKAENWALLPQTQEKPVDAIFFYATCYHPAEADDIVADIHNPQMLEGAQNNINIRGSIFSESCNLYVPLYRQFSIKGLGVVNDKNLLEYCAAQDIYRSLDYYFEHYNNGKPFILGGHSQGAIWVSVILQDYMKKHPEYLSRMVAAYAIGWSITKKYLQENPHLKFAKGATDTGVIISYNAEGEGNTNNAVVLDGAVAINPINWKTDETYAGESENLGSLNNDTLEITSPGLADARVDTKRGVVITTAEKNGFPYNATFGPKGYHSQDFALYYCNLRQNVADRIKAYMNKNQ